MESYCNSYGFATDSIREDFCNQYPANRSPRHHEECCVYNYGKYRNDALDTHAVAHCHCKCTYCHTDRTDNQQRLASETVYSKEIDIKSIPYQQAIGINAVNTNAPRIFENAGAEGGGMMQTVIMGIVNIVFTLVAIFTVDRFGRKPLLIIGSIGMAVGAFAVAMCDSMGIKGIVPVLSVIVYAAFFMMSWGPICWVLIAEIFPNTIRGKAVAIAVAFQWIFNYIISSTFPALYDFSPMFAYSLYGIICVAAAFFVWRWVPETKGKTLEDMSKLWRKNK